MSPSHGRPVHGPGIPLSCHTSVRGLRAFHGGRAAPCTQNPSLSNRARCPVMHRLTCPEHQSQWKCVPSHVKGRFLGRAPGTGEGGCLSPLLGVCAAPGRPWLWGNWGVVRGKRQAVLVPTCAWNPWVPGRLSGPVFPFGHSLLFVDL